MYLSAYIHVMCMHRILDRMLFGDNVHMYVYVVVNTMYCIAVRITLLISLLQNYVHTVLAFNQYTTHHLIMIL